MDIEKLIEQLNGYFEGEKLRRGAALDAATALSTLQDENEKLRAELKSKVDLVFQQAKELDRRHLLLQEQEADLEQVKRERDELERFLGELEGAVYTGQYFHLRPMIEKWRGQKED